MEKLVVEIEKGVWEDLLDAYAQFFQEILMANTDYTIKEVRVEDDFFKDDPVWHTMRKESNDLYKRLKVYEFNQRNKIKK